MVDHYKDIVTPNGSVIKYKEMNKDLFLNKTSNLFGDSGTGKSVLLNEIMHSLFGHIPLVFIWSPTANVDKDCDLTSFTPSPFIFESLKISKIKQIMDFNEIRKMYKSFSYDNKVLLSILNKTKHTFINDKKKFLNEYLNKINLLSQKAKNLKEGNEQLKSIKKTIISLYRVIIEYNYKMIRAYVNKYKDRFKEEEVLAIQYFKTNIEICLIFNDCGNELKSIKDKSKDSEIIKNLYTKGRHFHLTVFNLFQSKEQASETIISNAHLTFFTDKTSSSGFFRKRNHSKETQRKNTEICDYVLSEKFKEKHYKILYCKSDQGTGLYYVHSKHLQTFKFAENKIWEVLKNKEIGKEERISSDNVFKNQLKRTKENKENKNRENKLQFKTIPFTK